MADFINTIEALGDDAVMDALISRTITEFKDDSITKIVASAFRSCTQLTEVDCPEVINADSFYGCTALTRVNLPKLATFPNNLFEECVSLQNVSLPLATGGGSRGFLNCKSLVSADLPLVTNLGMQFFCNCEKLERLNIPNVTQITTNAFSAHFGKPPIIQILDLPSCSKIDGNGTWMSTLHTLILRLENVCTLSISTLLDGTAIATGNGYIYVPKTMVDGTDGIAAYAAATNWSQYAGKFRYIEDYTVDGTLTGEIDETRI